MINEQTLCTNLQNIIRNKTKINKVLRWFYRFNSEQEKQGTVMFMSCLMCRRCRRSWAGGARRGAACRSSVHTWRPDGGTLTGTWTLAHETASSWTKSSFHKRSHDLSLCLCVRSLSAGEVELVKLREERSHAQLLKQEVVRDTAATQEQLNGVTSLLTLAI